MTRHLLLFALLLTPFATEAKLRVVTTLPSLGALAHAVGGDDISVTHLAPPTSDPHYVDGRPSFVVALSRADLLIYVGLDLEVGWLPPLLTASRNARIQNGQPGQLDASTVCGPLLEVGGKTDRALGDVHPGGNPHYLYDPRYGVNVAKGIAARLKALDPDHAAHYDRRFQAFKTLMITHIRDWNKRMAPHRGKVVVAYHKSMAYLTRWLGLKRAGYIEQVPGIAPNAKHLAALIRHMRQNHVVAILSEPWYDAESSRVVGEKTGAKVVRLPGDVGSDGIRDYPAFIEAIVSRVGSAL